MKEKKLEKEKEELQPEDVEQPKAMDQMVIPAQDPAMIAQYQAYLQQLMQQYPAQYQQLLTTQQFPYGYNQNLVQPQLIQPTPFAVDQQLTLPELPKPQIGEDSQLPLQSMQSRELIEVSTPDTDLTKQRKTKEVTLSEPTDTGHSKMDESTKNAEIDLKCQNCGAVVKEGWLLCPECKELLM